MRLLEALGQTLCKALTKLPSGDVTEAPRGTCSSKVSQWELGALDGDTGGGGPSSGRPSLRCFPDLTCWGLSMQSLLRPEAQDTAFALSLCPHGLCLQKVSHQLLSHSGLGHHASCLGDLLLSLWGSPGRTPVLCEGDISSCDLQLQHS